MSGSIPRIRREYIRALLDETHVHEDPLEQFLTWFNQAVEAGVNEPNAMILSTVAENGRPSSRVVLLRGLRKGCFTFFTNYKSRKASEIEATGFGAITFFWQELERQVRVEGILSKVEEQESDDYFASRPRGSQIGAWASPQSSVITSREQLVENENRYSSEFEGKDVPRPPHWGGFQLQPDYIEFWQGRENRLHDRIAFSLQSEKWHKMRLAP